MKVLVINIFTDEQKDRMRQAAARNNCEITFFDSPAQVGDEIEEADIIYGAPLKLMPKAKNLKWIHLSSAGADAFCKEGVVPEDVLMSNSAGAYGVTLAEYMVMVTLMLLRRQMEFETNMAQRNWIAPLRHKTLKNSRVTLMGAGDIGQCYAKRIRPFEPAKITAISRTGKTTADCFDEIYPMEAYKEVFPRTDILVMSMPSTPETIGFINKETLALLPKDAYVINVGRGTAVVEEDLIDALENDRLAAACLDVMATEPLPKDDPLWGTKN
ncbi:MAG: D-2-hydroxyacid dehydrogenase, partial [Lachnospiraceae bacterium]|nr:D-2-hydroxyacid dehydrogenase [Candidatus Equihabitans merdae]